MNQLVSCYSNLIKCLDSSLDMLNIWRKRSTIYNDQIDSNKNIRLPQVKDTCGLAKKKKTFNFNDYI